MGRLFRWLLRLDPERRSARRDLGEGLTAFYFDGGIASGHHIRDISAKGAFVESDSMIWARGTRMILTVQIDFPGAPTNTPPDSIAIQAEVVRVERDGMGLQFLFTGEADR